MERERVTLFLPHQSLPITAQGGRRRGEEGGGNEGRGIGRENLLQG